MFLMLLLHFMFVFEYVAVNLKSLCPQELPMSWAWGQIHKWF